MVDKPKTIGEYELLVEVLQAGLRRTQAWAKKNVDMRDAEIKGLTAELDAEREGCKRLEARQERVEAELAMAKGNMSEKASADIETWRDRAMVAEQALACWQRQPTTCSAEDRNPDGLPCVDITPGYPAVNTCPSCLIVKKLKDLQEAVASRERYVNSSQRALEDMKAQLRGSDKRIQQLLGELREEHERYEDFRREYVRKSDHDILLAQRKAIAKRLRPVRARCHFEDFDVLSHIIADLETKPHDERCARVGCGHGKELHHSLGCLSGCVCNAFVSPLIGIDPGAGDYRTVGGASESESESESES
ncbi:MAG: hypothetical protein EPN91_02180 [Salinibacterium sp.]|nr:MAG: hypothetical protein EPN91_02180 [Salinibacterium sp.]